VHPTLAPGIHWADVTDQLEPADAATARELSTAWLNAGGRGQVLTVLVDVSSSMVDRLDHVKSSLTDQVNRLQSGSLELWQFSNGPRRLLDAVSVSRQRAQLLREIAGLQPQTASHLYPSVLAAYESALRNYQEGRQNRLVLISDGPDDSPMTEAEFTQELIRLRDGSPPLPISVLAVGPDPDSALPALADSTGGSYLPVADGTEIEPALGQLLGSG
jgi:Ca-activated chloride channel family protein